MEELKLEIISPNEGQFLKKIGWNRDEIKKAVISITEQYKGLAYTEEQLQEAKKDRARLNAMKKDISDRRIQVKKALLEPYEKFEAEVKEVVALIDEPIALIDKQIVAYEDRIKEEKIAELEGFFNESIGDLKGKLLWEMVFDQKWANKTVSVSSCKKEILQKISDVQTDLAAIKSSIDERHQAYAEEFYFGHGRNLSYTITEINRIQELERKAEEARIAREKAEQEKAENERITKEQEDVIEETVNDEDDSPDETGQNVVDAEYREIPENNPTIEAPKAAQLEITEDTKIYKSSFMVRGTKAQLLMLKDFMVKNGIEFGKVEN
mgnify:FL=1